MKARTWHGVLLLFLAALLAELGRTTSPPLQAGAFALSLAALIFALTAIVHACRVRYRSRRKER